MGQWGNQKKKKMKKYLKTNDTENTIIQNLWDATNAVLRGMFTANTGVPQKRIKILN